MSEHGPSHALRLFFAIELSDDFRGAAAAVARAARGGPGGDALRWVRPEAYHVTLRFLGEVDAGRVSEFSRAARAQLRALAPFELRLGEPCALPQRSRMKVLALGLVPEAPIARLAAAMDGAVASQGFAVPAHPFRPHLTLGRVRRGRRPLMLRDVPSPEPAPIRVCDVALFRSQLGRGGASYTVLERLALGGDTHPAVRLQE